MHVLIFFNYTFALQSSSAMSQYFIFNQVRNGQILSYKPTKHPNSPSFKISPLCRQSYQIVTNFYHRTFTLCFYDNVNEEYLATVFMNLLIQFETPNSFFYFVRYFKVNINVIECRLNVDV